MRGRRRLADHARSRRSPTSARALGPDDIVVSDVGAHKVWVARLYQAYEPNTVIISNGFAAMGISLPGRDRGQARPPRAARSSRCAATAGSSMNSQELETAKRIGANITVVVWRDDGYGLIDWKQRNEFGRPFGVEFGNPDFVAYAESLRDRRASASTSSADHYPTLMRALEVDGAVARRSPDRLPREPPPDRAARGPGRRGLIGLPAHADRTGPPVRCGLAPRTIGTYPILRRPSVPCTEQLFPAHRRLTPPT